MALYLAPEGAWPWEQASWSFHDRSLENTSNSGVVNYAVRIFAADTTKSRVVK